MKPQDDAPETVGVFRRMLAVALFIGGMFFLIILSCVAGYKDAVRARLGHLYDWLFETIIKINPNFNEP